ncbi:Rossmann-like and DUF2520 domain-containing protein [Sphingobacterium corticibacter]|uniref:DUF2520 domain-containing protein n=1 Tax=Sphingobacterium corticibacter TaxID=2171749 RepID=A0A2T8HHG3_9SPHI|nr:Rossmann-like and DUF2520 domain-containing protein [Sphingobacterium corticibacter]PVH24879.1 DUF2520 domain-containing protein [Sphingobacterium corticibacter]
MNIVLIGSGNVAHHLGAGLQAAGHRIVQVYSRTADHAQQLAKLLRSESLDSLAAISPDADLYLLAVTDQALPELVEHLPASWQGTIVHCSGATPLAVLEKWERHGVIYPPQSLSKDVPTDLSRIPFAIEGNTEQVTNFLLREMLAWAPLSFEANTEQRLALHLAAVFANNFSNAMYQIAFDLLAAQNLSADLIRPIILETANKVQKRLPQEVQTGPARRNDQQTMQKHLDYLKQEPDWQTIYQLISQFIKKSEI